MSVKFTRHTYDDAGRIDSTLEVTAELAIDLLDELSVLGIDDAEEDEEPAPLRIVVNAGPVSDAATLARLVERELRLRGV